MNIKSSHTIVPGMRARCDGMPSLGRTSAPVAVAERPRGGEHGAPCSEPVTSNHGNIGDHRAMLGIPGNTIIKWAKISLDK